MNLLDRSETLYNQSKDDAELMYNAFAIIEILSFLNLTYLI